MSSEEVRDEHQCRETSRASAPTRPPWSSSPVGESYRKTRLLEPQDVFLDFAGTSFGEASFGRDDAKAALLQHAARRDVVMGDAGVEGARRVNRQESIEGAGRDPLSPVGAADPLRDLALVGIAPHDPIVPATSPSTTMALLITVSSARSLLQLRWNASRSM